MAQTSVACRGTWALLGGMAAIAAICPSPTAAETVNLAVAEGKSLLYVENESKLELARAVTPADPKRIAQLEAWRRNDDKTVLYLKSLGFKVRRADEHAPPSATHGQQLIVISESVDALEVGTKYRFSAIPIVDMENDLLGELEMTGLRNGTDYGTDDSQRFIYIVNAPHPLAAGLEAGIQNVLTDEHYKMNWGKPGLGAVTIATVRGYPDKAAVFGYERGATMNGEFLAPARRVSLFVWQDTFEALRPEGMALFRAAVLWAAAAPQ